MSWPRAKEAANNDSWRAPPAQSKSKSSQNAASNTSSLFTICRDILNQTLADALQKRRDELDRCYSGPGQGDVVNYDDPLTHCTYLRTDVPYRALCLTRILEDKVPELRFNHNLRQIFDDWIRINKNKELKEQLPLSIVSIGCGPGTDLLGVLQFCVNSNFDANLSTRFDLCDRSAAWEPVTRHCYSVCHKDPKYLEYRQYLNGVYFHQFDLTDLKSTFDFNSKADLFTMSMVLSEVTSGALSSTDEVIDVVRENLWLILKRAKVGAYFLFVDMQDYRGDDVVGGLLRSVFERKVKGSTEDQSGSCSSVIRTFPFALNDEEWLAGDEIMRQYFPRSNKQNFKSKTRGSVVAYLYQKLREIDDGCEDEKMEQKQKNRKAKEWNLKGIELMREDLYGEAEEAFKKAVDSCNDQYKHKKTFNLNYKWAKDKKDAASNNK